MKIMPSVKVEVNAYSGYREEEAPRVFSLRGKKIEIVQILKRWVEEETEQRIRKRFFEVRGSDGKVHLLYYDEAAMEWFYRVEGREV